MSDNTRNIVDYAINDQGKELRDALYAEIHDRVTAQFEASKIALAQTLFATEETLDEEEEEEDAGVEGDEDEEGECSSKKKMKKEAYGDEDDFDNEEEYDDEDEEDEDLNEGVLGRFVLRQVTKAVPKEALGYVHNNTAKNSVDKHLGMSHPKAKDILTKHKELSSKSNYNSLSDDKARETFANHIQTLDDDIKSAKSK